MEFFDKRSVQMYSSIVNKTNELQTQFERERIEILRESPLRPNHQAISRNWCGVCLLVSIFVKKLIRSKFFDEINNDYTFYPCSLFYTLSLSLNIQRLHICNTFIYNYSCILQFLCYNYSCR